MPYIFAGRDECELKEVSLCKIDFHDSWWLKINNTYKLTEMGTSQFGRF